MILKNTILIFLLLSSILSYSKDAKMYRIAKLDQKLFETSGLVFYQNKYLITHNDGGNKSEIYILNLKGELIRTIDIDEAKNEDWEDLTVDDEGRLYIGDFGNNLNKREKCRIYILRKNFMEDDNNRINADKITFTYEDQKAFPPKKEYMNYDSEAFFWMNDSLYILTKCRTKPFTGVSKIYVIPDKPGKYEAQLIGKFQFCDIGWQWCGVTSADYNAKTKTLAVLTYSKLYLIDQFKGNQFWKGRMRVFGLSGVKQREAICFKGNNSWYLTDEYRKGLGGGNLYEVTLP